MSVHSKEGEYFKAESPVLPITIYGKCIQSRDNDLLARCYSELCPQGESGSVPLSHIIEVISEEVVGRARQEDRPQ